MSQLPNSPSSGELVLDLEGMPFKTDSGIGSVANLGLLVLRTDQTIEDEFRYLVPATEVGLYGARLHSEVEITPANLRRMETEIAPAVRLLPDVRLDVVGFACTSGALAIGEGSVAARIHDVHPSAHATDPVTAALAAMRALGSRRCALLTPYLPEINEMLCKQLQARGMSIPVLGSFNEPDDNVVARITPGSLEEASVKIGSSSLCDAVLVSCTSLRVARLINGLEARLGKPVTSSNHALAWHMLRLAGYVTPQPGLGRLFALPSSIE
jgi:maleate isomerase